MTGLTDYAGWLYGRPGMQELLLGLQDEAGQDVLLLLTACWLGQRRVKVDGQLWQSLHESQEPWREQIIAPLRQVRRSLAGSAPTADLYEQVKACELAAEWHQLSSLELLCQHATSTDAALQACILAHLQCCCGGLDDPRLERLATAASCSSAPWSPALRRFLRE